ncbi:tripartite motif-containing protein 55-like isoform X1 [Hippocampus comes]|uniref:tripartite motif-containing protein 55-like isoform X1 n=1 Tax=Hippocampus comes TaxID=109280 RepID=UPI00094E25FB|nr:PREDICTED: tripartite motif-containing protein 55-like isoform X1 [Hippocampus comes]
MTEGSGNFRCPSCHHKVVMDRHGVFSLQRNLLVESIIDIYKRKVCHNDDRPLPLPPSLPAQVTCSQHSDEKVSIYCITCQLATCSLCKVFGEHQSCQVQPLTDALQQKKEELREGVASMVQINQKVRALMDELEEKRKKIEETCKTQKQNVCDKFRRMFSILDERLVSMSERISKDEVEKSGSGQLLTRCYGDKVEANRKLMEKAVSAMEDPNMAGFVQNSKELIAKVKAAASFSLAETVRPSADKLRRFRCNFSQQEWAIAAIDFITLEDCTKPTQNTETTAPPLQTEDEPTEAPLWHSAPPLGLSESSIQDVDCEEEQLPMKEEAGGEAKELSDSQGEMTAEIGTQQAVIVLFYLVAFLVLLQKAWSCVGCFIYM